MAVDWKLSRELAELVSAREGACEDNSVKASNELERRGVPHKVCVGLATVGKIQAFHAWCQLDSGEIIDVTYAIQDWFGKEPVTYAAQQRFHPRHLRDYWKKFGNNPQ